MKCKVKYVKPQIIPLEEYMKGTQQCGTFSMPKRSCKALPSGVDELVRVNHHKIIRRR